MKIPHANKTKMIRLLRMFGFDVANSRRAQFHKMGTSHWLDYLEHDAGLGNATIRNWRTSSPSVENAKKVADILGVTIDALLCDPADTEVVDIS